MASGSGKFGRVNTATRGTTASGRRRVPGFVPSFRDDGTGTTPLPF